MKAEEYTASNSPWLLTKRYAARSFSSARFKAASGPRTIIDVANASALEAVSAITVTDARL
jgi:hypothetical protein